MDYRMIIAIAVIAVVFICLFAKSGSKKAIISTKIITRSAIFAAISIVLYLVPAFNIALPIFPAFLKIHIDEIPVFIAGFAYGPLSAVFILIVKTLAKLPLSFNSHGVGEIADLIYSLAFILPATIIYRKHRTLKGAFIGLGVGFVVQLVTSCLLTTFVMLKLYGIVLGLTEERILAMCKVVNPNVTNLTWPFILYVALPFNALKDAIVIFITILLYKRLHGYIDHLEIEKN